MIRSSMAHNAERDRSRLEQQHVAATRATKWILATTIILAMAVVVPTSVLTWQGKLSSDAASFLFGAIAGSAFTFLRDLFPRSG